MSYPKRTLVMFTSFLVFALLLSIALLMISEKVFADTTKVSAVAKDGPLNVRKGPGTSYAKKGTIKKGTAVYILKTVTNSKKEKWDKIINTNISGYVLEKYLKKTGVTQTKYSPVRKGTATEELNIRTGAGTTYKSVGKYSKGKSFYVYGKIKKSTGTWYKVKYSSAYRYVAVKYVKLSAVTSKTTKTNTKTNETKSNTDSFESYMTSQGFPASYKPYLRKLHKKHPKWIFKAQKTGIKWSTAVSAESVVGENLVEPTYPEAWKGMVSGSYYFSKGKYATFDGRWNQASVPLIKYYMDPRNGLNETNIYEFMTHKYNSTSQNSKTVKSIVSSVNGCFLNKTATIKAIVSAGKNSGMNPNVITAMVIMEQGWKSTSGLISGNYSGYKGIYNHFNICAYNTSTMNAVQHGLWWAKGAGKKTNTYGRPWNTIQKSLSGGAKFYKECYMDNKQNTYYLKKFNVMNGKTKLATHQYCTNVMAGMSEGQLVSRAYRSNDNYAIQFLIPVYENMPSSTYKKPGTTGNNNCYLKNLSVTGYKISPNFSAFKTSYKLTVPSNVTSVKVAATKLYSKATVTGAGTVSLKTGSNTVKVTVKATSGMKKTYKIVITRK